LATILGLFKQNSYTLKKSEGGGKRGKFQQQLDTDADNSCSDDDEPKEVGKAEGAKAGRQGNGSKHVGVSFSSSPVCWNWGCAYGI
jgi:hypothetical protein